MEKNQEDMVDYEDIVSKIKSSELADLLHNDIVRRVK